MKRLTILAAAMVFAACGANKGDEFKSGLPGTDDVKMNVPAKAGAALEAENLGTSRQALEGQTSDFYKLTRGVTVSVNGGTGFVLDLVKRITDYPATSVSGNTAVWGPHTEALSPNSWKLEVTKVSDTEYSYKLEGKAKNDPDTAFVTILSGTHHPALDAQGNKLEHFGNGTFSIDWDKSATLPEHDNNVGQASFTYGRLQPGADTTITVGFTNVKDQDTGNIISSANYKYLERSGQDGEFEFSIDKNIDSDPARSLIEHMTIKSRWLSTGLGRSDIKATGGDVGSTPATVNECWDANFVSRFEAVSWAPTDTSLNYGNAAGNCGSFTSADYSSL
ncbi:MAG: hypothetical protein ACJ790_18340 [Myxococcaceae bacterium]